jgi:hypothetical protein
MKRCLAALVCAISLASACDARAQTLYAASTRRYVSSSDVVGRLYVIDPGTAASRLVGPIRVGGTVHVGITGLAVHPRTGILYGITAGLIPTLRPSLVTIDTKSAEATLIGPLGHSGSDINFDPKGTLFIWLTDLKQLGTVNLKNGAATPRGPPVGIADAVGGGLAIDERAVAHIATTTAAGTLDTVDTATGVRTVGPQLSGAPYLSAIHSMTFSPAGELFGVNTNMAAPAKAALVKIDPATGAVANVGALPDDADGLAFSPDRAGSVDAGKPFAAVYLVLVISALAAVAAFIWVRRKR